MYMSIYFLFIFICIYKKIYIYIHIYNKKFKRNITLEARRTVCRGVRGGRYSTPSLAPYIHTTIVRFPPPVNYRYTL